MDELHREGTFAGVRVSIHGARRLNILSEVLRRPKPLLYRQKPLAGSPVAETSSMPPLFLIAFAGFAPRFSGGLLLFQRWGLREAAE